MELIIIINTVILIILLTILYLYCKTKRKNDKSPENKKIKHILLQIIFAGDRHTGRKSFLSKYLNIELEKLEKKNINIINTSYYCWLKICELDSKPIKSRICLIKDENNIDECLVRHSDCCCLFFDLTNRKSFINLDKWKKNILEKVETYADSYRFILIGNKCNLKNERKVGENEIKNFCDKNKIKYFEISCEENINFDTIFSTIYKIGIERIEYINDHMPIFTRK